MRKILIYSGFVIASLVVVAVFMTSTSYTQLAVAAALYPLPVGLAFVAFPRKRKNGKHSEIPVAAIYSHLKSAQTLEAEAAKAKKEKVAIEDIDKRAFLKLIGGVGLSFFLFSLINKKAGSLFPGGTSTPETIALKDTAGNKIDPVEKSPTDGYRITEIDDSEINFYGFTNVDNAWFIMRQNQDGSFRYTRGDRNFPDNWANRKNLKYDYYFIVFSYSTRH